MINETLTTQQMAELAYKLQDDGYGSIEEWMRDSDYLLTEDEGWVDLDDNPVGDPWIVFYWAKEAENDA